METLFLKSKHRAHAVWSILEKNKFYRESYEIAQTAVKNFPDSFEAWNLLSGLTNSSELDKARAKTELKRLDPYLAE